MKVRPYLFFEGRCQEAIDFYRAAVGAEPLAAMRYGDSPVPTNQPADQLMHAALRIGETEIFLSDGQCGGAPSFQGFSLTLEPADDAAAARAFAALSEGGTVRMPMAETFFASSFGMLTDRFGVGWMVLVQKPGIPA